MNTNEIEFEAIIGKLSYLNGIHYIEVPSNIVNRLGGIGKNRLVCQINGMISFQCGLVALGEGKAYINLTSSRMKSIGKGVGARINVILSLDQSEFGLNMPEELSECLLQDEEANRRFRLLSAGKQRSIIYLVSNVKSSQIKINRAITVLENLKSLPEGKETNERLFDIRKK